MIDHAVAAANVATTPLTGGFTFAWEINFTTVLVFVSGALAWWLTLQRLRDRVSNQEVFNQEVREGLQSQTLVTARLEAEVRSLRDEVYREYLSRAMWQEIKNDIRADAKADKEELSGAIRDLSRRVDSFANAAKLRENGH